MEISVLSQNTWLKPGLLGTHRRARVDRMHGAIRGYDVVALQETFSDDSEIVLRRSGYPYAWRQDRGDGVITLNSGLTILSRFPIVETGFRKFRDGVGPELFVRKGVQFTRFAVPGFGRLDVFNTHVQEGLAPAAVAARRSNILELAHYVLAKYAGHPTILAGDYNAEEGSPEYDLLRRGLGASDAYRAVNPCWPGHTYVPSPDNPYNDARIRSERPDYVFALRGVHAVGARVVNDRPVDGYMVSDHFGVAARLRLSRA